MARQQRVPESSKSSAYRRSSHKSSKRRKEEETIAAKPLRDVPQDQPNVEDLRRARQGYYAQTAQERERKSRQDIDRSSAHDVRSATVTATTPTAATAATAATATTTTTAIPVKVKKSTPQKSSRVDEHGRKRRKHRSSTTTSNSKKVNRRSRPDKETREHRQESDYVYSNVREETGTGSKKVGGKEREDGADDSMGSVLSTRRSSLERKEKRRSVSPRIIPPEVTRTASTRSRKSYRTGDASPKKSKSKRSSGVSSYTREKDGHRSRDFQPVNSHQRSTTTRVARSSSNRDHCQSESRPQLKRRTTKVESVRSSRRISESVPQVSSSSAAGKTSASKARESRKSAGLFGSIFAPPKPQTPEKKVECLTCLSDDVPISKAAKLSCGHRMCHACLRRIFTMSVTDPQHMPPRCCTQDNIPLKHVDRLFNDKFKILWNKKYQEYTTKNRIYCPARGCGEWIKPSHIRMDSSVGRRYGKCSRCKMKVCCLCNGKWHTRKECPKDEETKRFVEIAKEAGWQRCYSCKAMVELKEGCNHMTCRCTAEFCMLCGNVWKTCDCPWFNYTTITDQLNGMNVPEPIRVMIQQHGIANGVAGAGGRQQGRRRMPANVNYNPNPRNPALTYQQEMDRRRTQERADEDLARRLQEQTFNEDDNHDDNDNANRYGEAAAAAAARIYIHNYHRYRARREHANRSNDDGNHNNNRIVRNQIHDDPNGNVQMQGRAAAIAVATQLAGAAFGNMRAVAAETVAEPARTAPRATTGTTARRAEMRRATAAALARSTASVDLQMEAEGSQRQQESQNQRQRRRESQRRREGRARRVQDNEPAIVRRASKGTGTAVMAGLSRDGRGVESTSGAGSNGGDVGRVGAWLQHVEREEEVEEEKKEEEEYAPLVPGAWRTTRMRSAAIG